MKKKIAFILTLILLLTACRGGKSPSASERNFYYQDTKWGMTLDEVLKLKGEPDLRSDEMEPEDNALEDAYAFDLGEDAPPEGFWDDEETAETDDTVKYIDFYYNEKPIFENKYTATEQYLFDEENKLWGVINLVDIGEVSKDLMNREDIVNRAEETYLDIREMLTEQYGPPAAEYTAYSEAGEYKTDETLDLKKEYAVICASRWDGDNYRFIYIIYFLNDMTIDIRYIPHDKETVDKANVL